MDEFALIRRYFAALTPNASGVALGIGDDAALLMPTPGHALVVTTDTLIEGLHFARDAEPADIAWKALAVNLSDLAAMGAQPRWFTLALTLPQADADWLAAFAQGLQALADRYNMALIGGDTTRGALSITITALGEVPQGDALRRDGARVGDAVCVTGTLGDAALGLRLGYAANGFLRERLDRPMPRIEVGIALRRLAHAAIDLSDGLAGDLQHVLEASGVGAHINVDALPLSAPFLQFADPGQRRSLPLGGGDDYELCVCLPAECIELACAKVLMPLTVIGRIVAEPGLHWVDADGATIAQSVAAYRHFT
ncbi:thiamine-phosphate kinase [Sinimarinibacterium sp. NLF-5-8]|uniref:thiamine-phosphate kinase n=1 Tax=Sinimarinibacterium sp. NLF-5-8 TaxID=2698684 RepID=UPI00137C31DE|nr:thiamine-phosphate kinase [Sinimarinibacterium sp. NLF-5-8]QHS09891.1 thiamine-phosphate kinase [Sinimarinibacterium sp. NLF-5-8]